MAVLTRQSGEFYRGFHGNEKSTLGAKTRIFRLMGYLLDTNICIYIIKGKPDSVLKRLIRSMLEKSGNPIGPLDTLIAAHAKSIDYVLVTNNEKEFRRVQELEVENWVV